MKTLKHYTLDALVGFDGWCNTMLGGEPDVTISSRAAQAARDGKWWGKTLCQFLHWLDANHCEEAVQGDIQRAKETIDFEEDKP